MKIEGKTKEFIQNSLLKNENQNQDNCWNVLVSISHEDEYAIATATLQSLD